MKSILIFSLICFSLSIWGPADKAAHPTSDTPCFEAEADSLSDCVDLNLYNETTKTYYDKCCFIRVQFIWFTSQGCQPLTAEEYLDIVETKRKIEKNLEKELKNGDYVSNPEGYSAKVYQLDCSSSYVKFLSFASILLELLF